MGLKNSKQSTRVPEQRTCFWYCPAIAEARPQTQNTDEVNDVFIRIRQDANATRRRFRLDEVIPARSVLKSLVLDVEAYTRGFGP
jgi:hypothetical protein